jgi:hypothetical protein
VYGTVSGVRFRCEPEAIEKMEGSPPAAATVPPPWELANGHEASVRFDGDSSLQVLDKVTGQTRQVKVSVEGAESDVFCLGCQRGDLIYGGANHPANVFFYDTAKRSIGDLGLDLGVQTYAVLAARGGVFFTTYTGGRIYFYDPNQPLKKKQNPLELAQLSETHLQERLTQLVEGPEGRIYIPTRPMKGQLGGAIARVDSQGLGVEVFRNVIPEQSITSIAAVQGTRQIFCTSTIQGGTSAIPTQHEACVFLWDVDRKEVVFTLQPQPGASRYDRAVGGAAGVIYFCCQNVCYVFDVRSRKVISQQEFPVRMRWFGGQAAGSQGPIYGVGDDALFALDPANHHIRILVRHPSLAGGSHCQSIFVSEDLHLYYGIGSHLWRCSLAAKR